MPTPQEQYDDASFLYAQADYDGAIRALESLLAEHPDHFDARLALGMAHYRKGDFAAAIREGHVAEQQQPKEQLVHTNLSLFYMRSGDKLKAEHHGLQARIAGWRENMAPPAPGSAPAADPELQIAQPKPPPMKTPPVPVRDMPWKKKAPDKSTPATTEAATPGAPIAPAPPTAAQEPSVLPPDPSPNPPEPTDSSRA